MDHNSLLPGKRSWFMNGLIYLRLDRRTRRYVVRTSWHTKRKSKQGHREASSYHLGSKRIQRVSFIDLLSAGTFKAKWAVFF